MKFPWCQTLITVSLLLWALLCIPELSSSVERSAVNSEPGDTVSFSSESARFSGKRILWVSSYHRGYEANDDIERGLHRVLKDTGIQLRTFFMDTKRNNSTEYGEKAGGEAMAVVKSFDPDLIIASDDNAQKYLVAPYLVNSRYPVVFCGLNGEASSYGYPAKNITGMIEIDLVHEMLGHMRQYARGDRIGYLSGDVTAERKMVDIYNKKFFSNNMRSYLVSSMAGFKETFLRAQQEVDMLYIYNYTGIKDWNPQEAELFLSRHTRIPTGSHNGFMSPFVVFVVAKSLEEHGEYAARTALKILEGTDPAVIRIMENRRAELYVNLRMAKAASIVLPVSLLKTATVVASEEAFLDDPPEALQPGKYAGRKVVWLDSYHQGYAWSDGLEKGIRNVLYETGADLKIIRMNTKLTPSETYGAAAGSKAWQIISSYNPDVVIASDDKAQKYLVVPYLKEKGTPVVFCGVSWDGGKYGYPAENVTGMVEVEAVEEMLRYLHKYSDGSSIGYLAGDNATARQLFKIYNDRFFNGRAVPYFVNSMEELKKEFIKAMDEVDSLLFTNYAGIKDWDTSGAEEFFSRNTRIPTGSFLDYMSPYVVFCLAKMPEEQGSYAAKTALRLLDGIKPVDVPIRTNRLSRLTVNLNVAGSAGIVLPYTMLRKANITGRHSVKE